MSMAMSNSKRKTKVAALSILSNAALIILKIVAGVLSGSVSILSEAIHSSMDLVASLIAFFSVKYSSKPADKDHPYGHGKIENISGVIEGLLIFVAAILIMIEAAKKIIYPSEIKQTTVAISVMVIAAVANFFVSRMIYRVAKEEDSIALEADALHLKTDIYTSLGVGVGILLIQLTGVKLLDPIVAILVACLIIREAWELVSTAFKPLLDGKLSDEEEEKILQILNKYSGKIIDFHDLRTRRAGNVKFIDFHITVNKRLTVEESHHICDLIEKDIGEQIVNTNVTIHIEPDDFENTRP